MHTAELNCACKAKIYTFSNEFELIPHANVVSYCFITNMVFMPSVSTNDLKLKYVLYYPYLHLGGVGLFHAPLDWHVVEEAPLRISPEYEQ